jgi:SM-20-related protein
MKDATLPSSPAPNLIQAFSGVASHELHAQLWKVFLGSGWRYGSQTDPQAPGQPFWHMDLTGIAPVNDLWKIIQQHCESTVGHPLKVIRQYANGHTFGQGGKPHIDDDRPGCYTFLYYPMLEWQVGWEGETVFFGPQANILHSFQPRPNTALLFDSRIIHMGRAPSRACPQLRVSVAFKLERG